MLTPARVVRQVFGHRSCVEFQPTLHSSANTSVLLCGFRRKTSEITAKRIRRISQRPAGDNRVEPTEPQVTNRRTVRFEKDQRDRSGAPTIRAIKLHASTPFERSLHPGNFECGARAKRRRRFGFNFVLMQSLRLMRMTFLSLTKAPSPLRSAGALQIEHPSF